MEEKRILWIGAAVGVFLLIIVGTALILYSPSKNGTPDYMSLKTEPERIWTANTQQPAISSSEHTMSVLPPAVLPSDAALSAAESSASSPQTADENKTPVLQSRDLTVISNNTTVVSKTGLTTIDLTGQSQLPEQQPVYAAPGMQAASDVKTVVPVNPEEYAGSAAAVAAKTPVSAAANNSGSKTSSSGTAKTQTVSKTMPAVQTSSVQKKTAVKKTAVAVPAKITDRYWVQAASFTDKINAETARGVLTDEKIPAEVFTYQDKKGITYYRLRIGPYTTESEAEYWNSRIKLIDQFALSQSYVTNSSKPKK